MKSIITLTIVAALAVPAVAQGQSATDIRALALDASPTTTRAEARVLREMARREGLRSVMVVTEAFHAGRAYDPAYCYELFRRAIEDRDDAAWAAIEQQYKRLILSWVLNRSPGMDSEDAEAAAQDALSKFWRTLARRSEPIAERFDHVGGLLGYLKQCAVTSLIDRQRQAQHQCGDK